LIDPSNKDDLRDEQERQLFPGLRAAGIPRLLSCPKRIEARKVHQAKHPTNMTEGTQVVDTVDQVVTLNHVWFRFTECYRNSPSNIAFLILNVIFAGMTNYMKRVDELSQLNKFEKLVAPFTDMFRRISIGWTIGGGTIMTSLFHNPLGFCKAFKQNIVIALFFDKILFIFIFPGLINLMSMEYLRWRKEETRKSTEEKSATRNDTKEWLICISVWMFDIIISMILGYSGFDVVNSLSTTVLEFVGAKRTIE